MLGIEEFYESIDFGDVYLRVTESGLVNFSCMKADFDKWSNSQEVEFDLLRPSERRAFLKAFESKMQKSMT